MSNFEISLDKHGNYYYIEYSGFVSDEFIADELGIHRSDYISTAICEYDAEVVYGFGITFRKRKNCEDFVEWLKAAEIAMKLSGVR